MLRRNHRKRSRSPRAYSIKRSTRTTKRNDNGRWGEGNGKKMFLPSEAKCVHEIRVEEEEEKCVKCFLEILPRLKRSGGGVLLSLPGHTINDGSDNLGRARRIWPKEPWVVGNPIPEPAASAADYAGLFAALRTQAIPRGRPPYMVVDKSRGSPCMVEPRRKLRTPPRLSKPERIVLSVICVSQTILSGASLQISI